MSSPAPVSRLEVSDAVLDRLSSGLSTLVPQATVHDAEIPFGETTPLLKDSLGDVDPSGRVAPYVVYFGGTGGAIAGGEDLAETHQDLTHTLLLHAAGPYRRDVLNLVDAVTTLFYRWTPTIDGCSCSQLKPPPGYDAGAPRYNDTIQPPRYWLPMQYVVNVSR